MNINLLFIYSCRYIAVCAPFFRLRHNIKARFYILPIVLFAPLYNIPRFFEFETRVGDPCSNATTAAGQSRMTNGTAVAVHNSGATHGTSAVNMTDCALEEPVVGLAITEFRENPLYISVCTI